MKIEHFTHENVLQDGTFVDQAGSVKTDLNINHGIGCSLPKCHCSDTPWFLIGLPRTENGEVEGVTIYFECEGEYDEFIKAMKKAVS